MVGSRIDRAAPLPQRSPAAVLFTSRATLLVAVTSGRWKAPGYWVARAAVTMTRSTVRGWDSMGRWPASTVVIRLPAR